MPKQQQLHGVSRQRPVSCRFCRSRKLRCSREAPCSNCISRGLRCELERYAGIGTPPEARNVAKPDIVERIRKLEDLLKNQTPQQNEGVRQISECPVTQVEQAPRLTTSSSVENIDKDVVWLESVCGGTGSWDKIPSNKIVFRICSIQHIMETQPYINQNAFVSSITFEPSRCISLPQYGEAKLLLEKFIQDIDHIHHVVHTPSLPSIIDEVYACLRQQGQVKPGHMVLLLGILASSTHCWVRRDSARGLFSTSAEANSQSSWWVKAMEDVLDITHRTASVSIEGIQGIIVAVFVLMNLEGTSRRCKSLWNMAFMLARELQLHCLDHPSNANTASSSQVEMGRRVWWYLVASDWAMAARLNGPGQGVYQCHMRQMMVKKPMNINDEDLVCGKSQVEQPLSQPTTMSYSLHRIRLAEISRNIVDRNPLVMTQSDAPSHDVIMDIDTELQLLINDTPPFFSMSIADLIENYQLTPARAAEIFHQGYMFYSLLYAQRCKLHLPYFSKGFRDTGFASSRQECLRSAHLIIQTEVKLDASGFCTVERYKFLGLFLAVFMASRVLLVDLCHNKSSHQAETRRGDIADALRILEEARQESETAAKFLDSLLHVLRKHKISPPERAGQQSLVSSEQLPGAHGGASVYHVAITPPYSNSTALTTPVTSTSVLESSNVSHVDMAGDGDLSSYFNDLAQSFEQGLDAGSFDWDSLFLGLDSSLM